MMMKDIERRLDDLEERMKKLEMAHLAPKAVFAVKDEPKPIPVTVPTIVTTEVKLPEPVVSEPVKPKGKTTSKDISIQK